MSVQSSASGSPTVERIDPRSDLRWHELAAGPGGSLFTCPPWLTALSATYGFEPEARVAVGPSGETAGGVAWIDVSDVRGRRRLALPFSDRAEPLVPDAETWGLVSGEALSGDLPFTMRCLDTSPAVVDPRLTCVGAAAWHETSLDRPIEEIYAAFKKRTRRDIKVAQREGVKVVLSDGLGALLEFHGLHVRLRKEKYRLLAQPQEFFRQVWEAFTPTDGIWTALALVDGETVAGAVYLIWQDKVYLKHSASRRDRLQVCPNEALHWTVIQWAHERGLRALDWGSSDLDQPGLCAYKTKWASTEGRIRTLNAGGPPLGRSSNTEETLRSLTRLLTDRSVPDAVTEQAGAVLYRYFC